MAEQKEKGGLHTRPDCIQNSQTAVAGLSSLVRRFKRLTGLLCITLLILLIAPPSIHAQDAYVPYAWTDANLALIYPASWSAPVSTAGDDASLTLTLGSADTLVTLTVLPASVEESALRPTLETQVVALNQLPLSYAQEAMYGRSGLRIDTVSADRQQNGIARSGRLPDDRALLIASRVPRDDQSAFEQEFTDLFDSIVFSAAVPPVRPAYHPLWTSSPSANRVDGLVLAQDRIYTVDTEDGVQIFDAMTGAALSTIPFDHPAAPTAIAVDAAGIVYVADTVCRCIRKLNDEGRWFDSVGSFGGGAPFSLAVAADGTIYATDLTDSGYVLRILGEPYDRTVGLNFNASAPPLVTLDASGNIWVVEWLASLIDGTTNAAVSQVVGDKPAAQLQFWFQGLTPQTVSAFSATSNGNLLFATKDQGILFVDPHGQVVNQVADEAPSAVTFSPVGAPETTLYLADTSGDGQQAQVRALSTRGTPDRYGASALVLGVPVLGTLSESAPDQTWMFDGSAGQTVTLSAVDQSIADPSTFNLDMAIRLLAPDGSELAYNDDQLGTDLFGVYDAEISDFALPQTGTYTVHVEWRQGQGIYTLGINGDRSLSLNPDGVTEVAGRLQDVFPVQSWAFNGHQGDVLTFTMSAESGTLDPALALFNPDGKLVAYNDDAYDPELKINAQLAQVRLAADGTYIIEASRYDGAGRYTITIVNTA